MALAAWSTAIRKGVSRVCSLIWMTLDQCLMNSLAFLLVVNFIQPRSDTSGSLCWPGPTGDQTLNTTDSAYSQMYIVTTVCFLTGFQELRLVR